MPQDPRGNEEIWHTALDSHGYAVEALISVILHYVYGHDTKTELPQGDRTGASKQTVVNGETSPTCCCQRLFLLYMQRHRLRD